jgi:Putative DNA-binding domain
LMQSFPRLTSLFGAPVDELDENAIQSAITSHTPEDFDLDWKEAHYPQHKNKDMASDIAQLANTFGGIIVLGVKEQNGRADAPSPVSLGDDQEGRIRQVVNSRIRPFLPGVAFRSIETSPGVGYLIIVVPQSADAPHAVLDDKNKSLLAYPVRDGTTTRWLSEYEVAARYRDRYQARAAVTDRLDVVHTEGISHIALWKSPWLAVSLVPLVNGHRGIGSEGLAGEQAFLEKWRRSAALWWPFIDMQIRVFPGIRRGIVTETWPYAGRSADPHAELHYDGSGFGSTWRLYEPAGTSPGNSDLDSRHNPDADKIFQDAMEIQILALVFFLARHAVDTGAAGECLLRAQQLLRQQTGPDHVLTPAEMCEPSSFMGRQERNVYDVVRPSLMVQAQTQTADTSVFLDELVSDPRAVVRISYGLAADILSEFGVPEPIILRPDGLLNVDKLLSVRRQAIELWARGKNLVAPPGA